MSSCLIKSRYTKIIKDLYNSLVSAAISKAVPALISHWEPFMGTFLDATTKIPTNRTECHTLIFKKESANSSKFKY